jgi:protein-S-isoprenylcysteine O-methyltransferase Ste14
MNFNGEFFMRWRVRVGYPLAVAVLWFAQPRPRSIFLGGIVGVLGLLLRAYAAGYLHKQEVLTVTGPYAYSRNPLYLGSSILAVGAGIAARSWISALILLAYFALFYSIVMRREERELQLKHGSAFNRYAATVPLFFPRLSPARIGSPVSSDGVEAQTSAGTFSFTQYSKNHEWQAAVGFVLLLIVLFVRWGVSANQPFILH